MVKRKRIEEVDWAAYFYDIRDVCPWSWSAWKLGQISVRRWHSQVSELQNNKAQLYTAPNHSPRLLKKITDKLNGAQTEDEFLWSHPQFAHKSTPVPTIIQQNREYLYFLRERYK